jgi:hypothetical protein
MTVVSASAWVLPKTVVSAQRAIMIAKMARTLESVFRQDDLVPFCSSAIDMGLLFSE